MTSVITKLDEFLEKVCFYGLVVALTLMLSLSLFNIVGRWFSLTFSWIDPFVRHLVFLSAFLGGGLATGSSKHIGIDLVTKLLENPKYQRFKKLHQRLISLFCVAVLLWLSFASYQLARIEFEFGRAHFMNIHSGYLISIIPLGFILIGLRFFFRFLLTFKVKEES